jgi:hypothetical protein
MRVEARVRLMGHMRAEAEGSTISNENGAASSSWKLLPLFIFSQSSSISMERNKERCHVSLVRVNQYTVNLIQICPKNSTS